VDVKPKSSPFDPEPVSNTRSWLWPVVAIAVLVLLLVGIVGLLWLLTQDAARTANIRDIVIIFFAFTMLIVSIVTGVLLGALVFQLQRLIALLRDEIRPMLGDAQKTIHTVRGTTEFVSESVAQPAIKVASFFAGLRGMGDALRQRGGRAPRAERTQNTQK
jgi:MFS superfamily sulfate permease-like transporter